MPAADPIHLDASSLLAIDVDEPERVFAFDAAEAREQWRALSSRWHPDRNADRQARWVFGHLHDLYRAARSHRDAGLWRAPGLLQLSGRDGREFRLRHLARRATDSGEVYVGERVLAYALAPALADLAGHAERLSADPPFADERMRAAMAPCLPGAPTRVSTAAAEVLVYAKADEFVTLRDLLAAAGGTLPAVHVAWLISALLNLCCYLHAAGLAHHAIDLDHCLVSPANHAVQLAGGWWFAGAQGAPLAALPARSARLAPPDVLHRQMADVRLDQFLVRATAMEALGDQLAGAPAAMREFLTLPPGGAPVADYEHWQRALWESFGERRFVPLAITAAEVNATLAATFD